MTNLFFTTKQYSYIFLFTISLATGLNGMDWGSSYADWSEPAEHQSSEDTSSSSESKITLSGTAAFFAPAFAGGLIAGPAGFALALAGTFIVPPTLLGTLAIFNALNTPNSSENKLEIPEISLEKEIKEIEKIVSSLKKQSHRKQLQTTHKIIAKKLQSKNALFRTQQTQPNHSAVSKKAFMSEMVNQLNKMNIELQQPCSNAATAQRLMHDAIGRN